MYNKIITFGMLLSFFAPAIILARLPFRLGPKFALQIFGFYSAVYLVLGISIKFLPNLVNPW